MKTFSRCRKALLPIFTLLQLQTVREGVQGAELAGVRQGACGAAQVAHVAEQHGAQHPPVGVLWATVVIIWAGLLHFEDFETWKEKHGRCILREWATVVIIWAGLLHFEAF